MTAQALGSPVVTSDALRSVNFFNGRLLTGDDLRSEQTALQARLRRLGRAAGEGIAYGLEVSEAVGGSTPAAPVVTVTAGLALARSGLALELGTSLDLLLARGAPVAGGEPGGLFADCQPSAGGTYTAGAGVYLLTVGPATQKEGLAPVNGLGNQAAPCNTASSVETVQFRLIRLALDLAELADKAHLRSRVAYQCFAPDPLARDPFGPPAGGGLIETLRAHVLSADETPLAVIGWSASEGIGFVDQWAVRRRLGRDAHRAEREAMTRQFQAQLADLRVNAVASTLRATDAFSMLPPAGLVPLHSAAGDAGFDLPTFFTGIPHRADPVFLEGARVEHVLETALFFPPVDPASGEAVRLHLVRENQVAGATAQPYVLFTSGHAPYEADGRFDLALWNFANYAER